MPPRKSAARGSKPRASTKEGTPSRQPPASSTQAPATEQASAPRLEDSPEQEWGYWYTTFRQHIGFLLGALSIFLTWFTWEEGNPNSPWRAVGCLCVCMVGLAFHELRPFKRRNYGDLARERLVENPTWSNVRAAMG